MSPDTGYNRGIQTELQYICQPALNDNQNLHVVRANGEVTGLLLQHESQ